MNVWVWIAFLVRMNLAVNLTLVAAGLLLMGMQPALAAPIRIVCIVLVSLLGLAGTRIALTGFRTLSHGL